MTFRIKTLWAFLLVDDDDEEAVILEQTPEGLVAMIAADSERIEALRPRAQAIAEALGREVKLVRFSARSDQDTLR